MKKVKVSLSRQKLKLYCKCKEYIHMNSDLHFCVNMNDKDEGSKRELFSCWFQSVRRDRKRDPGENGAFFSQGSP